MDTAKIQRTAIHTLNNNRLFTKPRPMINLPFIKMHGLSNDYVYIDCFAEETAALLAHTDLPELARRISDRHTGAGSDGLVLILPDNEADARMRMFNADGSEAQMCGNAIRCVGKYLYESYLCRRKQMTIATQAGIRELALQVTDGLVKNVKVNMGIPVIAAEAPILDTLPQAFTQVNMGNPHAVFFSEYEISSEQLHVLGRQIATHPHFSEGTNVEFACVRNRSEIDLRVWERGSGETMACGTGACATVVAACENGFCKKGEDIRVILKGGTLMINYTDDTVWMTGDCAKVFEGTMEV